MAVKTLICGLSGTGKSRSMKNFMENGKQVAVVNPGTNHFRSAITLKC